MSRLVYLNRPSQEVVLDLINAVSTLPIELSDITFSTPTKLASGSVPLINRNTRLELSFSVGGQYAGHKTVYYNRLDLGVLFGVPEAGIPVDFSSVSEALTLLNQYYGLAISPSEIDLTRPATNGLVDIVITDSLVYLKGSKITLQADGELVWFENSVDLYYEYVNTTLYNALTVS